MAEGWITEELRNAGNLTELDNFYTTSQPMQGLYKYMTMPEDYADYYKVWATKAWEQKCRHIKPQHGILG